MTTPGREFTTGQRAIEQQVKGKTPTLLPGAAQHGRGKSFEIINGYMYCSMHLVSRFKFR